MKALLWAILTAARDKLRTIREDKAAVTILLVAALAYGLIYPIPYQKQLARKVPIVVVDQDGSIMSRQLVRMVDATEQVAVCRVVRSMAEAEDLVRAEAARGAVVIPVDFERSIQRGEQVVVGVFGDASYFMVYSQIATGAGQATGTLAAGIRIRRLQASGANEDRARKARNPLPIDLHPLYNPSGGYGNYLVPAVLILILQQTLLIGIGTLAGTRREQAGTAKVQPSVLVECLGQAMAYTGVYLVNAAVVFTVVFRVFDLPSHGPLLRLLVFLLPFLIAVSFLGLTLAAFFRSRESALQALMFTSLPAIFVSGFSFPREAMPRWLQWWAQSLPSTHGIAGGLRIFQMDATLHDVQAPFLFLWLLAATYFLTALIAISRRRIRKPLSERS